MSKSTSPKRAAVTAKQFYASHKLCPRCRSEVSQTYAGKVEVRGVDFVDDVNLAYCGCGWSGPVPDLLPPMDCLRNGERPERARTPPDPYKRYRRCGLLMVVLMLAGLAAPCLAFGWRGLFVGLSFGLLSRGRAYAVERAMERVALDRHARYAKAPSSKLYGHLRIAP